MVKLISRLRAMAVVEHLITVYRSTKLANVRPLTKNHFAVIVAKGKLDPSLSPYSLRHSHISTPLGQGLGVLVVAARMGHSSPKMTLDTYGHTSVADRQAVVDVLDKLANS